MGSKLEICLLREPPESKIRGLVRESHQQNLLRCRPDSLDQNMITNLPSKMMIKKYLPVLSDQVPDHFHHWAPHIIRHPQHAEGAVGVVKPIQ